MPTLAAWLAFVALATMMVLSPGPNMVYLASRSICQGTRAGFVSLGGVALGFVVWMLLAVFGISAMLVAVPVAYEALRIAGAMYLLWLAWCAIRPGASPFEVRALPAASTRRLLAMGFATNLLNPKAAVLYLSLLPQFIDPDHGSVLVQGLVFGATQIAISVLGNSLTIVTAGRLARFLARRPAWLRAQRWDGRRARRPRRANGVRGAALRIGPFATCWCAALLAATAHAAPDEQLLAAAKREQQPVLDTLKAVTAFDSGTLNGPGVARVADLAEAQLKAMGFATEHVSASPSAGPNLVARKDGRGTKRLLLLAHMDTVYLDGTAAKQPFRVDGNRAYGVGIVDDKAGIAVVLHATRILVASGFDDFARITILFNADEERGSPGSRELIRRLAAEADATLSFEGTAMEREQIRTGTSGIVRVVAEITGKASHAGAAPERGVNALVEASDLVRRTQGIDDRSKGLRFNWTLMRAGEVSNVIPDHATVEADMRYQREADLDAALATLRERAKQAALPGARIELAVTRGRPPLVRTDGAGRVVALAQAIYREVGLELDESAGGGGGTDAAYAAQTCAAVVESMGLPGFGAHANAEEYVLVDRIPMRLYLAAALMKRIAQGGA